MIWGLGGGGGVLVVQGLNRREVRGVVVTPPRLQA